MSTVFRDNSEDFGVTLGTWVPAWRYVSNITQASQAVVTFTEDHTYTVGEILSFRVSPPYGMIQMNNLQGRVLSVTDTTVTMEINSRDFFAFVNAGLNKQYPAVCVPVGSGIVPNSAIPMTNLEDVFDNPPPT